MGEDLGARVLREGLVSREQLADALAEGASGGILATALLRHGLDEGALHGLLLREGYEPASADELVAGTGPLSRLLHGRMAHTLQALPVEDRGHEVVVAMVDPSDTHALRELRFGLGRMIRARVALAGELRQALASAYPGDVPPEPRETPLALVRRRPGSAASSASGSVAPRSEPSSRRRVTRPMVPITAPTAPEPSAEPPPEPPVPTPTEAPPRRARSIISPAEASWGDLEDPAPRPTPARPGRRRRITAPPPVGPLLADLRRARDRDTIVRLTCDGVASVAKVVVFLALRRGVLRGWEARGGQLTPDAVRNLWIPIGSPSVFKRVIATGESYEGPHGTSTADDLFRAATGSRGGRLVIHAVRVAGKPLGALCAEGVRFDDLGRRRVEELVLAAGRAFERVLADR